MWLYGSGLDKPRWYADSESFRLQSLTDSKLHRGAHAGMNGAVGGEVPKLVTLGEVDDEPVGNDSDVNHDAPEKEDRS